MQHYVSYKPSNIEWIGDIPEHWEIQPIRALFHERKERNDGPKTDFILSVMKDIGVIPYDEKGNVGNKKSENIENYKVVYPGDLVVNKMNAIIGSLGISRYHGALSQVYFVLHPRDHSKTNHKYLGYLFKVKPFQKSLIKISRGMMELRESIEFDEFKKLCLPVPSLAEQDRIVNFLDQKTSEIDSAIAKKQRLIELLQEQKSILINQAVTRGLNLNVAMRDSGVEWLGVIPVHWHVKYIKHLYSEIDQRSITGEETLFSLRMSGKLLHHNDVSDKPITTKQLVGYKQVFPQHLVMNRMRASMGLFAIAGEHGLVSPDYAIFNSKVKLSLEYFLNLFRNTAIKSVFRAESKGLGTGSSGFLRLYSDKFGSIKVPFPPVFEQIQIVDTINKLTENFAQVEMSTVQEIDRLKELKSLLIAQVVLGQIKI